MMKLEWDEELAEGAKLWAEQCNHGHDTNRDVCRFKVGQNLYIEGKGGQPIADWNKAIQSWYIEVSLYSGDPTRFQYSREVGHFTQVVAGCKFQFFFITLWSLYLCNFFRLAGQKHSISAVTSSAIKVII